MYVNDVCLLVVYSDQRNVSRKLESYIEFQKRGETSIKINNFTRIECMYGDIDDIDYDVVLRFIMGAG